MDDTFVTPVFNGSTSLRNAAGELIESVTKSMRRSETVDDAYIDSLFDEVSSLYHLDQAEGLSSGKADLGPLPQTAIISSECPRCSLGIDHPVCSMAMEEIAPEKERITS